VAQIVDIAWPDCAAAIAGVPTFDRATSRKANIGINALWALIVKKVQFELIFAMVADPEVAGVGAVQIRLKILGNRADQRFCAPVIDNKNVVIAEIRKLLRSLGKRWITNDHAVGLFADLQ